METGTFKILLIEDDPDDAEMTAHTLSKLKVFNFHHIDDGPCALEFLFSEKTELPAMILLDLKLPKVDGIEILERLKSDPQRRSIPVFVMISSPDGKSYVESFGLKADGYLLKPVACQPFVELLARTALGNFSIPVSKLPKC